MQKRSLLLAGMLVVLLAGWSLAEATSEECDMPAEIKALRERRAAGEELTKEEMQQLHAYGAYMRLERIKADAPDEIKALIEKRQAREQMTYDERRVLNQYIQQLSMDQKRENFDALEEFLEGAPEEILAILNKRRVNDRITEEERKAFIEYVSERRKELAQQERAERIAEQRRLLYENAPANVKAIMDKREAGDKLTKDEGQALRAYMQSAREKKE